MGSDSHIETIKRDVQQGYVLESLLFIIYTNSLPECLDLTKSILFSDNTTVYLSSKKGNLFIHNNEQWTTKSNWLL